MIPTKETTVAELQKERRSDWRKARDAVLDRFNEIKSATELMDAVHWITRSHLDMVLNNEMFIERAKHSKQIARFKASE